MKRRNFWIVFSTVILIAFIVFVGVLNVFTHGTDKEPTFSPNTRILMSLFMTGLYLFILGMLLCGERKRKLLKRLSIFLILVVLLSWNYMYNSMDVANKDFLTFQQDSEGLVTYVAVMEEKGEDLQEWKDTGFGLGGIHSSGDIGPYKSQYGLQGKVFNLIARYMDSTKAIAASHLFCSLLTASVFVLIVFLLDRKYNRILAGCFLVTFWLSPWIVNFARNLYWVEFSWFVPMAIGLICSMKIKSLGIRIGCCCLAFFSIMLKSLCGYEYMSTVMMGLVAFPVIEMLMAFVHKDRKTGWLFFKMVFFLGLAAIAGFTVAVCIHAPLKGNGSIIDGIKAIMQDDMFRMTSADAETLSTYNHVFWPSLNASVWDTYCLYFHFSTEIITGVPGNLFPILCILPIVFSIVDIVHKKPDLRSMFMYGYFFLAAVSWFCLAKSHSHIHTHMNFVLWYFGFVQACFYIIVKKVCGFILNRKTSAETILE